MQNINTKNFKQFGNGFCPQVNRFHQGTQLTFQKEWAALQLPNAKNRPCQALAQDSQHTGRSLWVQGVVIPLWRQFYIFSTEGRWAWKLPSEWLNQVSAHTYMSGHPVTDISGQNILYTATKVWNRYK